ncbi:hypothetical protein [Streptomyces sp. NPDC058770]|uniref:hypothetical protein n=1 Tax=unclassified Streptomyces TaxID=2593676 RepID=UPI0036B715F7
MTLSGPRQTRQTRRDRPDRSDWHAWRVRCASASARGRLLVLVGGAARTPWFWADLLDGGASMEFAVPVAEPLDAQLDWITDALRRGLVTAAQPRSCAAVCSPGLFPHGRQPLVWGDLLAATSNRAHGVLTSGSGDPSGYAPQDVIADEVTSLYSWLVPERHRSAAADWHLAWLEATAGHRASGTPPPTPPPVAPAFPPLPGPGLPAGLAVSLHTWSSCVARTAGVPVDEVWTPVVARLCHIQAVRLGGTDAGRRAETAALLAIRGVDAGGAGRPAAPHGPSTPFPHSTPAQP